MDISSITDGKMQQIPVVQSTGRRFSRRKLALSIVITISLLLIVSAIIAWFTIHTKSSCGADDTTQKARKESTEPVYPEPTQKADLENTTAGLEPTHKLSLQDDSKGDFKPLDCYDILMQGNNISGVYFINPFGMQQAVYCDQETDGGGWTVFQRRCDGSEDFYRGWYDYQRGFGHVSGEFWLGNQFLSMLMKQRDYMLRIDMEDFENERRYAQYNYFRIGDRSTKYRLTVRGYVGTAGDSLSTHNGRQFSTKDQDNDPSIPWDCAKSFKGAWWYSLKVCHESNLNGLYLPGHHDAIGEGINWKKWTGWQYSLKTTEMKCRPVYL